MTKLGETQTTVASWMDSVKTEWGNHADWSVPSTSVDNSGSDNTWQNNAVVGQHVPTGLYLMWVITDGSNYLNRVLSDEGIKLIVSEGWDSNNDAPSGKTNLHHEDQQDGSYDDNIYEDSPNAMDGGASISDYNSTGNLGLRLKGDNNGIKRLDMRSYDMTHYTSINSKGMYVGGWNTTDSDGGKCTVLGFTHLTNKYWDDGKSNFFIASTGSSDTQVIQYAWGYNSVNGNGNNDLNNAAGIGEKEWGFINQTANDDTYFFRWHPLYALRNQREPIGELRGLIYNDNSKGGAHGDIIKYENDDYVVIKQSGANGSYVTRYAIRYV